MTETVLPTQVECKVCGEKRGSLYSHILKEHNLTTKQYREQFPKASLNVSEEIIKVTGRPHGWKGRKRSEENKQKLSDARKGKTFAPHSKKTIIKMQDTWAERKKDTETYDEYRRQIGIRSSRPEILKAHRDRVAIMIKAGKHNGKSKDTKLERQMVRFLEIRDVEFEQQFIVDSEIGGFTFDFYLPSMNLLVETDGEYWHKELMVINRDRMKEAIARKQGYNLVRISDKAWNPMVIFLTNEEQLQISKEMFDKRLENYEYEQKMFLPENIDEWMKMKAEKAAQPRKSQKGIPKSAEHRANLSKAKIESNKRKREEKAAEEALKLLSDITE